MSGNSLFVDTNILIYFLQGDQDIIEMISDKDLVISFVTELELLSLNQESQEAEQIIHGILQNCFIIDPNQSIKDVTVELRRKYKLKLPDSIIASTSYYYNIPLLTADKQFKNVEELELIFYRL